ncbi:hypothetical protein HK099_007102, partial [Clydaea vesicula]
GLVGLPNVGKSSLFNLLTEQSAAAENYPFCTIEPNESRCAVPDARYDYLCSLWKPPSCYPAYLQITDIAGLIKGASEGAGLGNAFLSHIQAVDGMFHIVRIFENSDVIHVDDEIDPIRDIKTINDELCKKDITFVENAMRNEEKAVKAGAGKYKLSPVFKETFAKMMEMLEQNIPIRNGEWTTEQVHIINEKTRLITTEPMIYLLNMTQADYIRKKNKWLGKIAAYVKENGGGSIIPFSVEFEQNLWNLREDPKKQEEWLKEVGATSALPKIVTQGYNVLNLIYYFTAGEKEVRCWTIPNGALAPQAAGVIHSDFERGFIKAEVAAYDDFKQYSEGEKSMAKVKAAGKYRQEGKTYVVKDGDIIYFQFNVTAPKKK